MKEYIDSKKCLTSGYQCECGKDLTYSNLGISKLFSKNPPVCECCLAFRLLVDVNELLRLVKVNSQIKTKKKIARVKARERAQSLQQLRLFVY